MYELQKLCDAVPSYPTPRALALIEQELGSPASELFLDLDESTLPIAAALICRTGRAFQNKTLERYRDQKVKNVLTIENFDRSHDSLVGPNDQV